MLIKSDVEVITQLKLQLYYDNNTVKKGILKIGDILHIKFRRKFKVEERKGKIIGITNVAKHPYGKFSSAVIEMDFADEFDSCKMRIPVEDIIDFTKETDRFFIGNARIGIGKIL